MGGSRGNHMDQFCLVSGGHHDNPRQVRQKGHVKCTGMGRPIGPDQPGTVNRETHRQPLDRNVMHHLIIPALQERRIHRAERFHPARSQRG